MRILVVEDDAPLATFVRKGLEAEHYAVDVAEDGELARQMAADSGATRNVVKMWVAQWNQQQQGAQEQLPVAAATDAGTPVHENTVKCWLCGGEKVTQNLRLIYLHWYELDSLKRILTEAGMVPGGPPAAAAGA